MEPITGTFSVTLEDVTVAPAAPPYTYFGVTEHLMPGIELLAAAKPHPPGLALPFLCAHVLECLLKASIAKALGATSEALLRDPKIRHDLTALWALATSHGLRVPTPSPDWVNLLGALHKSPFYLRYSTGVHGIVSPGTEPMVTDLRTLVEVVREQLRMP